MAQLADAVSGVVTTTSTTEAAALTYAMPDNCVALLSARVVARRTTGVPGASVSILKTATFKRHSAAVPVQVSATNSHTFGDAADMEGASADFDVSGNSVRLLVSVNEGTTTVEWLADMQVHLYQP